MQQDETESALVTEQDEQDEANTLNTPWRMRLRWTLLPPTAGCRSARCCLRRTNIFIKRLRLTTPLHPELDIDELNTWSITAQHIALFKISPLLFKMFFLHPSTAQYVFINYQYYLRLCDTDHCMWISFDNYERNQCKNHIKMFLA